MAVRPFCSLSGLCKVLWHKNWLVGANPNAKNNAGDTPIKLGFRLGLTQIKAPN